MAWAIEMVGLAYCATVFLCFCRGYGVVFLRVVGERENVVRAVLEVGEGRGCQNCTVERVGVSRVHF